MATALSSEYSSLTCRQARQTRRWLVSSRRSMSLIDPRCANAASCLNFWWPSSRSLCMVPFLEPLNRRTFAQALQATIQMVAYIPQRFVEAFTDLPQFETLEVEQF